MCTEPETLIPLVGFSPNVSRIILIGDHMQLQPIIKCTAAKKARLDKSLFQRYAERDDVDVIMLTEQYRMVRAVSHLSESECVWASQPQSTRGTCTPPFLAGEYKGIHRLGQ